MESENLSNMVSALEPLTVPEAIQLQFKLVDGIHRHFPFDSFLEFGDLGLTRQGRPNRTAIVEEVMADFFDTPACSLVRGAGSGAIRLGIESLLPKGKCLLVHDAPIYPTTRSLLDAWNVNVVVADYNNLQDIVEVIREAKPGMAIVQHTRQLLNDSYDLGEVVTAIQNSGCPVLVDDNYAILKTRQNGASVGAALSAFSLFKLLGPEGIGCLLGSKELIEKVRARNVSGGSQVQSHEAMAVLRAIVNAPLAFAVQAEETQKVKDHFDLLKQDPKWQIANVYIVNMQSRVILVEFSKPIAQKVLEKAKARGASSKPVGAESTYELPALFYKASRTFLESNEKGMDYFIRINPMRSGAETVIRILTESIGEMLEEESCVC